MNNIVLAGRITREPELQTTTSGIEYLNFSLAVQRQYSKQGEEKQVDFINCTAWRKTAVFVNTYFRKGDGIVLSGRLEGNKYVDKDGNNRTSFYVNVENVEFPLSKSQRSEDASSEPNRVPMTEKTTEALNNLVEETDDDLPF